MKSLIFLHIIMFSLFSNANYCKSENVLLTQWRQQKDWQDVVVKTPETDGGLQYGAYVDKNDKYYLKSFEINEALAVDLKVDIKNKYSKQKYLKMCRDDYKKGRYLSAARKSGSQNKFSFSFKIFPGELMENSNPLTEQSFVTEDVGIRLILKKDSMVVRNTGFFDDVSDVKQSLEAQINNNFVSQENSADELVVNLDSMDDLACDLARGKAELEFYQFSKMKNSKVKVESFVSERDVKKLYSELQETSVAGMTNENLIFNSGKVYGELEEQGAISIASKTNPFNLVKDLFSSNFSKLNKITKSEQSCIAENHSLYSQSELENSMILNLKTQNIYQMLEE